ncbi:MAG: helix-turn-helix domain-containing protein [Rhodanobacter sp.]
MAEGIDVAGVMQRLRTLYGAATDAALSEAIGVPKTTLSSWRTKGRLPIEECVQAVRRFRCSWDWLLDGTGTRGVQDDERGTYDAQPLDERMQRIAAFLRHWGATRNADEQAWLEMQLARAVPEYAEWLARQGLGNN